MFCCDLTHDLSQYFTSNDLKQIPLIRTWLNVCLCIGFLDVCIAIHVLRTLPHVLSITALQANNVPFVHIKVALEDG